MSDQIAEFKYYDFSNNFQVDQYKYVLMKKNPIKISRDEKRWDVIKHKLQKKFPKSDSNYDSDYVIYNENPHNLIAGTVNLINILINRAQAGDPIDTLVFLDKSARPGAYLFNLVWRKIETSLSTKGPIIQKPKIRFINIGREVDNKYEHGRSLNILGTLYYPKDFEGNVMVVDEYIASGSSVKQARKAITDAGYHPKRIEAIQQFQHLPSWYHYDAVKGVKESPSIYITERKKLDQLPSDLTIQIKTFIKVVGPKEALRLVIYDIPFAEKPTAEQIARLKENGLDWGFFSMRLAQACNTTNLNRKLVLNYFVSHGGFTALPPDNNILSNSLRLRDGLKYILDLAFSRQLVKIDLLPQP